MVIFVIIDKELISAIYRYFYEEDIPQNIKELDLTFDSYNRFLEYKDLLMSVA